jgi:hypothetical protein
MFHQDVIITTTALQISEHQKPMHLLAQGLSYALTQHRFTAQAAHT